MTPFIWLSREGKTYRTESLTVVARDFRKREHLSRATIEQFFRVLVLNCSSRLKIVYYLYMADT
jgi:hypothetical protein